jgi:hypothetical protein
MSPDDGADTDRDVAGLADCAEDAGADASERELDAHNDAVATARCAVAEHRR